jgi:circadian clock protein KaiC
MSARHQITPVGVAKSPSGIQGLDEITGGGLPRGRPSLVCGSAGSGKTLLALEFLVRGALDYDEPGVFIAFEETAEELAQNVASLGFDLKGLIARKKLAVDYIYIERSEIEETGEYDLDGLFIRLASAIDSVGAKRVALDTLEALFGGLSNTLILRSELRRLFRWLKSKGVTAMITAERGDGTLTRHGMEEYVSDCVILLDHRVNEQVATRRLRIVKYRGSTHGTNEYPFLIGERGFSVLPITSLALKHSASTARISSGIPQLDEMLGGKGYYRGSSVLVSGTAGTGKTSVAAHFVDAACRRGERCLYFAFEESQSQILRNMRSIGIDLQPWVDKELLRFHMARPTTYGLETHLAVMHKLVIDFEPRVVIMDPINNLTSTATLMEVKAMLMRLMDFMKASQVTALFTSLTSYQDNMEQTDVGISSLMDTWLLLRNLEASGERNRGLYVLKSRGMAHSDQIREFTLTDHGVGLREVYLGPAGVLTGSARVAQEIVEQAEALTQQQEIERKRSRLEHKRQALDAKIAALRAEFEIEVEEMQEITAQDELRERRLLESRAEMAQSRGAGEGAKPRKGARK